MWRRLTGLSMAIRLGGPGRLTGCLALIRPGSLRPSGPWPAFQPAFQPLQPGQHGLLPGARGRQQNLGTGEFQQQPRGRRPAHLDETFAEDLRGPGQLGLAEPRGLLAHPVQPVGGQVKEPGLASPRNGREHDQVTEPVEQVRGKPPRIVASLHHAIDGTEHRGAIQARERICDLVEQVVVGVPEQRHGLVVTQPVFARASQQLVENRERIARRPSTRPHHQGQHRGLVTDPLGAQDLVQQVPEDRRWHQPERIVMRPRPDGGEDLLWLGRGEDELEVRRRFLDELEQRVEPLPRHHVSFIDDVDLEPRRDW